MLFSNKELFPRFSGKLFCGYLVCSVFLISQINARKYRYASEEFCDRHSLDAVYNEKFKLITANIFKDSTVFVSKVNELMSESLSSIMLELPSSSGSTEIEKKIFESLKAADTKFSKKIKKIHTNVTSTWNSFVASNFDLLIDNGKSSLKDYLKKTQAVADAYQEARNILDTSMSHFIYFIKDTIKNGINGINMAANHALEKEKSKKNDTKEESQENDKEKRLLETKLEIAEMILQGFLKNITIESFKRNMDLFKQIDIKPENRDTVIDDIHFDIVLIKSRIASIIQPDLTKDKGSIDLARRNIYSYWADQATQMYKDRLGSKKTTQPGGDKYYQKLWSNEEQLVDTLLNLMEVY